MDKLAESPSGGGGLSRRWMWVLGIGLTLLIAVTVVLYLGRIKAVYELYWGRGPLYRLFYEDAGLSDAFSSLLALFVSFFFAIAWVPLSLWVWRLAAWRFTLRQAAIALACWLLIYGTAPLIHTFLGSDACFNQRTGEPLKWYVEEPNGKIILFDSGGYDTTQATQKLPVTPAICSAFARQKVNARPNRITANIHSIEFFDPNNGAPLVWYTKEPDGTYLLFDASGFNPSTGEKLLPATRDVVNDIMTHAEKEAEQARQLAAKEAQERAAREEQAAKEAEQARQAEIARLHAEETQAKADVDRRAAAKQAEEARIRTETKPQAKVQSPTSSQTNVLEASAVQAWSRKDFEEAMRLHRQAAEQGDTDAMWRIGYLYGHGEGVPVDYVEAVRWFRKSADLGNHSGMHQLGVCYMRGLGVSVDYQQAIWWFRKAAELGDVPSMNSIGYIYHHGLGGAVDYNSAMRWYRTASDNGNADGAGWIGYMYEHGQGVPQSLDEARKWYALAASRGNPYSISKVRELGK
jgi:hypothetical protein